MEHSKTGFARYVNMIGTTKTSKVQVAAHVTELWASLGLRTIKYTEGEYEITQPDYWVVRLSLLGIGEERLRKAKDTLKASSVPEVRELATCTAGYMDRRVRLLHDAEERAFVNVAGGPREAAGLRAVQAELQAAGLGTFVQLVPGPLLRSTSGSRITHESFASDSTYAQLTPIMTYAYEQANADPADTDPERDLQGRLSPKFGNHSWRRFGDKVARDTMDVTGTDSVDIDLYFGWHEKMHSKDMQLHYAGRPDRVKRSRVSMMI